MKQHFYIFAFVVTLTACNKNDSTSNNPQANILSTKVDTDKSQIDKEKTASERLSFNNILEVVQYKKSNAWFQIKDSSPSLALHFNLIHKDTLSVSYSPECWLMYPFKTDNNKIIVYWNNIIDSKYSFDIVKAINRVDKSYVGKPFIILELVNDTTLKATYPIPDLVKKINNSSKKRIFFPNKFIISQDFYL